MPLTSEELAALHSIVAATDDEGPGVDLFTRAYAMPVGDLYALAGMYLRQTPTNEGDVGNMCAQFYALYAETVELAEATGSPRPHPIDLLPDWQDRITEG